MRKQKENSTTREGLFGLPPFYSEALRRPLPLFYILSAEGEKSISYETYIDKLVQAYYWPRKWL